MIDAVNRWRLVSAGRTLAPSHSEDLASSITKRRPIVSMAPSSSTTGASPGVTGLTRPERIGCQWQNALRSTLRQKAMHDLPRGTPLLALGPFHSANTLLNTSPVPILEHALGTVLEFSRTVRVP